MHIMHGERAASVVWGNEEELSCFRVILLYWADSCTQNRSLFLSLSLSLSLQHSWLWSILYTQSVQKWQLQQIGREKQMFAFGAKIQSGQIEEQSYFLINKLTHKVNDATTNAYYIEKLQFKVTFMYEHYMDNNNAFKNVFTTKFYEHEKSHVLRLSLYVSSQ